MGIGGWAWRGGICFGGGAGSGDSGGYGSGGGRRTEPSKVVLEQLSTDGE